MKNIMMVLLEGGYGPNGTAENIGVALFYVAIGAFVIAAISFLTALIVLLANLNSERKHYKIPLKIGLICLLIAGVSLLLTSFLCSWWG